jgi:hypothetical protein
MLRAKEAKDLDTYVLAVSCRTFGEDHPCTVTAAANLARDVELLGETQ